MRKTSKCEEVFKNAKTIKENYYQFDFRIFKEPADEPIFALAMAMCDCKPIAYSQYTFSCYTNTKLNLNMKKHCAFRKNGTICPLVHWGSRNTTTPIYKKQVNEMQLLIANASKFDFIKSDFIDNFRIIKHKIKCKISLFKDRIIECLRNVKWLRKLWHFLKRS